MRVKNRYNYFLKKEFHNNDSSGDVEWNTDIYVPFVPDELIVKSVVNFDNLQGIHILPDASDVVVDLPYAMTLHMDGIGSLCSFTPKCSYNPGTVYKLNNGIEGSQRFKILNHENRSPTPGIDISSILTVHLEFVLYEK